MKRINNIKEIEFEVFGTHVYVLDKAVLISLKKKLMADTYEIKVTNANYSESEFDGKSYGSSNASFQQIISNLEYWIEQSKSK